MYKYTGEYIVESSAKMLHIFYTCTMLGDVNNTIISI